MLPPLCETEGLPDVIAVLIHARTWPQFFGAWALIGLYWLVRWLTEGWRSDRRIRKDAERRWKAMQ